MSDVNDFEKIISRIEAGQSRTGGEARDMAIAACNAAMRVVRADENVNAVVYTWVPHLNGRFIMLSVRASEPAIQDMLFCVGGVAKGVPLRSRIKAAIGILLARDMSEGE